MTTEHEKQGIHLPAHTNGTDKADGNATSPAILCHAYFESLEDIAYLLDTQQHIICLSNSAAQYIQARFGVVAVPGDNALTYVEPEMKEGFSLLFTRCVNGEKIITTAHTKNDDYDQWWEATSAPIIVAGKVVAVSIVLKNTTNAERMRHLDMQMGNVSRVGAWEMNFVNGSSLCSPVLRQMFEVPEGYDLTLDSSLSFCSSADQARIKLAVAETMSKGTKFDMDFELVTYKHNRIWIKALGEAEFRNGTLYRLFGTMQDITDTRRVYDELSLSQQYYRSLFDHNPDAVFALDLDEQISSANSQMATLAETDIASVVGKNFAVFIAPQHRDKAMADIALARSGKSVNCICTFITAKGKQREVSLTTMPVTANGKVVAIYIIAKDISEQIVSRSLIEQSEANLKTVFDNTEIGYLLLTDDLRIISFNKPAQDYIISRRQKLLKEDDLFVTGYNDERGRSLKQIREKVLRGDKVEYERFVSDDGKTGKWYNIIFHPVYGEHDQALGIIMEIENITERKKSALELERSFNLLNEQNKRLLNFSYITSHNLRSHTSNIKSIVSFLEEAESPEEQAEMMEHLKTVSNSLDETIHNLNDVVSINNSVNLVFTPLFLVEFISKATDLLKEQIIQKQVIIENKLMIDATVNFNPAFLESIMLNFLSNAIKYSHPGRRPVITLDSYMDNDQFVLTIADNGIGIDLEKNGDKLFGFYKTFNGNSDARGLGLFICKNQVEYMGGKIEVESKLGEGTTFKIFFK